MTLKLKPVLIISILVTFVFLVSGCGSMLPSQDSNNERSEVDSMKSYETESTEEKMIEYKKITPQEAYEMMNTGGVIVLDVRTKQEYEQGHIENSLLLPVDEIKEKAETVLPDKKSVILIYCRSGNRSFYASKDLIDMGYENVYDFGGIISWPYEIVS